MIMLRLACYKQKIENSSILTDLKIKKNNFFLASFHREENIESSNLKKLINILNSLEDKYRIPIIFSTHPRTRKKLENSKYTINQNKIFLKHQSISNYLNLQVNSKTVLSDSGTINEESSILKFPALNLRDSHERPEAMEETSVMMVGMNKNRIFQALEILFSQISSNKTNLNIPSDYSYDNISEKVLRIIISYTDYVKNVIWRQYK